MTDTLWNHDEPIAELVDIPAFIDDDLTACQVAAIIQGGCASGAYMPAVSYCQARATMNEHGDEVLQYIEDYYDELPKVPNGSSWSQIAVFYLSLAVDLWAASIRDELLAQFGVIDDDF